MMVIGESAAASRKIERAIVPLAGASLKLSIRDAIGEGVQWLASSCWIGRSGPGTPRPGLSVIACVVARLAEVSSEYLSGELKSGIEQSLDLIERSHVPGSGWRAEECNPPDAFTTSWAILALRAHHRAIPTAAINLLLNCRRSNGGFSAYPADGSNNPGCPETTVTALRALNMCDRDGGDFLTSRLRNELSSTLACKSRRFYICSEILDWEAGLAPWPLLNLVSQSAVQFDLESAYDQALLLRMLLRLRNQRAHLAASALHRMQLADGSWPGFALPELWETGSTVSKMLSFEETSLIASVTALSALSMNATQPDLHYRPTLLGAGRLQG